jgi:hypothetical protein
MQPNLIHMWISAMGELPVPRNHRNTDMQYLKLSLLCRSPAEAKNDTAKQQNSQTCQLHLEAGCGACWPTEASFS